MSDEALIKKLTKERKELQAFLGELGKKHPHEGSEYDVVAPDEYSDKTDAEDQADFAAEFEARAATKSELQRRLQAVEAALEKLKKGTYGICEKCKKAIEPERLQINIAARFCGQCIKQN